MSLCILDLLVSSILGRPSATVSLRAEIGRSLILKEHREDSTRAQLYASYALADMMETIGRELYGQKAVATSAAEQFLQRLGDWSKELPETMRTASSNLDTPEGQEFTLGSIQVVCFYYFASMLVTRPFLISTLTARLVRSRQGDLSESATPSVYEDPIHIRLASACVDSAEYLIQACQDAQKAGLLLANMCIMKYELSL